MEYQNFNDYEILYLISENNELAYECMYSKYNPYIKKRAFLLYKKYKNVGIEYDDLIQEGMFGLSEALKKYNVNEGNLFFTLATLCIKREMERVIIKAIRNKNNILNYAYSLDDEIASNGLLLKDTLYKDEERSDNFFDFIENNKYVMDLKYELKEKYAPTYELKLNGFSNQEICELLGIKYKDVDNNLRSIKLTLKKFLSTNIE